MLITTLKFFYDGKTTWPDRGLETEEYNESRRREKASEKYGEINHQNWICKWILGCFLLVISISFVIFLLGDANTALGILFILAIKSPLAAGSLYFIMKNKKPKRKLELHLSDNSLTAMYDWDVCKCRQCGGSDFAEIKSEIASDDPFSLFQQEQQILNRNIVLRCPHHGNAALQCNGCGKWGYDQKKLDSNLEKNFDGEYQIGRCPNCGSTDHSMIIWGLPDPHVREYHRERGDDVIYGGCCVPGNNPPNKSCNDCGNEWRT